jgi:hypothetical protein
MEQPGAFRARYVVRNDGRTILESLSRQRQVGIGKYLRGATKLVALGGVLALLAVCLYVRAWPIAIIMATCAALLALGPRADYWLIRRKWRQSPLFDKDMEIEVGDAGYVVHFEDGRIEATWRMITRVQRLADGFLLYSGAAPPGWWPDAGLREGSVDQVAGLLRANIADFRSA